MALNRAIGIGLVLAGLVLVLAFPDLEVLWFQGRPLGIVLIVLGVIDVVSGVRGSASDGSRRGLGADLRGDARELRDDLR